MRSSTDSGQNHGWRYFMMMGVLLSGCAGAAGEKAATATATNDETMAQQQAIQPDRIDEIRRICMRKANSAVPACWSREYERTHNQKMTAQVTLQIVVAPGGTAQEVRVIAEKGGSKELDQCLVDEAKSWTYPEGTMPAPVECTFFLQSSM